MHGVCMYATVLRRPDLCRASERASVQQWPGWRQGSSRAIAALAGHAAARQGAPVLVGREVLGPTRPDDARPRCAPPLPPHPGSKFAVPVLAAPMAMQRMAHHEGEAAVARAAATEGAGMVLSSMATMSAADVAAAAPGAPLWYQLYVLKDRSVTERMVKRAEAAGFKALVVTVDAPRLGRLRTGFGHLDGCGFVGVGGSPGALGPQLAGPCTLSSYASAWYSPFFRRQSSARAQPIPPCPLLPLQARGTWMTCTDSTSPRTCDWPTSRTWRTKSRTAAATARGLALARFSPPRSTPPSPGTFWAGSRASPSSPSSSRSARGWGGGLLGMGGRA